jgi:hypothetical protein
MPKNFFENVKFFYSDKFPSHDSEELKKILEEIGFSEDELRIIKDAEFFDDKTISDKYKIKKIEEEEDLNELDELDEELRELLSEIPLYPKYYYELFAEKN